MRQRPDEFRGEREALAVVQEKGNKLVKLWVPCHPAPDAARNAVKECSLVPLTILMRPDGKGWGINQFRKAAGVAIRAAGLSSAVWHGLRTAGLTWASEGGLPSKAPQGVAGHLTPVMPIAARWRRRPSPRSSYQRSESRDTGPVNPLRFAPSAGCILRVPVPLW